MVKYFVLFFLLVGSVLSGFGQNKCKDFDAGILFVESIIEPPGGMREVMMMIHENLQYPESAKRDSVSGAVVVRFWVDSAGYTSEHTILKGVREDLDAEALRVARFIRFNTPPMLSGKPVGDCIKLPIRFPPEENMPKPQRFWKFFKRK